jgi:threonine synthase
MARVASLQCVRCGATYPADDGMAAGCPGCAAAGAPSNVAPVYADRVRGEALMRTVADGPGSMWRYAPLLPVDDVPVTLGEGGTPLIPLPTLGARWGLASLFVKDESRNPTGSWKDRMFSVALTRARAAGHRVVALASSGNAGASAAAYAARAGVRCVIFTTASAPAAMQQQMRALGAILIATRAPAERWTLLRVGVEQFGWRSLTNFVSPPVGSDPYGIEGYKTIACEIAEALRWRAPSWVLVPTCYGDGLWGMVRGFEELRGAGVVEGRPRPVAAEVFGPLAAALAAGAERVTPVPAGSSVAVSIAAGISTYQALHALRRADGLAAVVTDDDLVTTQAELAEREGLFAEPSAVAGLAAARTLRRQGVIRDDELVVAVITAGGLKDPAAAARTRPAVPIIEATPDALSRVLRDHYGISVEGGAT